MNMAMKSGFRGWYLGALLCAVLCGMCFAEVAVSAEQPYVTVHENTAQRASDKTKFMSRTARTSLYPQTGLEYYTSEAQGIVCPRGKVIFISAFGDSLVSGYGLNNAMDAFPMVLQETLRKLGYAVVVENDGIAGNTTAQGRARLPKVLLSRPDIVILELGANDMLQHRSVDRMKNNLAAMIRKVKATDAELLFAGMYAVPHLGKRYTNKFDAVFPDLAAKYNVLFYPFFLEGVALDHALNQQDGHHPNAAGVRVIVRNILPYVVKLIGAVCKQPTH